MSLDLDIAIDCLFKAGSACHARDYVLVRGLIREAAERLGVFLDVASGGAGSLRTVQEYLAVACKALCTVRDPPALAAPVFEDHDDGTAMPIRTYAQDAARRAEAAIQAAWLVANGRSP